MHSFVCSHSISAIVSSKLEKKRHDKKYEQFYFVSKGNNGITLCLEKAWPSFLQVI